MRETQTAPQDLSLHQMYMRKENGSPEYQYTIAQYGRKLTPHRVEGILRAHGFTPRELLDDESDNIVSGDELPATLDAALLFAWLGY